MLLFSILPALALLTLACETRSLQHPLTSSSSTLLQQAYEAAYTHESANWVANVSTDPFYQSPKDVSAYPPGHVIRLERLTHQRLKQYKIPLGLSMYRMLYQSRDLDEKPVPASAFILLPYAQSQHYSALNVIVWAHGTSGIERQCAPSVQRNLYYDFDGAFAMTLRGYAVIAPDYAGLGSDTTFNYLASPSHAADVAYAVVAARHALPPGLLTYQWVVIGHSEGGLTAWATNERELKRPIGGFLGAVAIAPALQNIHILRNNLADDKLSRSLFYASYTLSTIARLDNSVDVKKYFTDVGLERTWLAADGCYKTAMAVFANLTFADVFKDQSWLDSTWAVAWENRTAVSGDKPLAKPLLLIEGLGDRAVLPANPDSVFAHHCDVHPSTRVHISRYPQIDHDPLAFVSQLEYFDWIEDRFNGKQVPPGCTSATVDTIFPEVVFGD